MPARGQEETDQKTDSSGQYGGHGLSWQGKRRGAAVGLSCGGVGGLPGRTMPPIRALALGGQLEKSSMGNAPIRVRKAG